MKWIWNKFSLRECLFNSNMRSQSAFVAFDLYDHVARYSSYHLHLLLIYTTHCKQRPLGKSLDDFIYKLIGGLQFIWSFWESLSAALTSVSQTSRAVVAWTQPNNCVYLFSMWSADSLDSGLLALCGPNRVLQESTCECVCRNGLTEDSCDPGWKLDHNTCKEGSVIEDTWTRIKSVMCKDATVLSSKTPIFWIHLCVSQGAVYCKYSTLMRTRLSVRSRQIGGRKFMQLSNK